MCAVRRLLECNGCTEMSNLRKRDCSSLVNIQNIRYRNECEQQNVPERILYLIYGEFDSGSERTLAAWIRHASRTGNFWSLL